MKKEIQWSRIWNSTVNGKHNLFVLFLVGILLVVIAMPTEKKEESIVGGDEETQEENRTEEKENRYEQKMEQRLSRILSEVEGVGKNKVMITLQSTSEKVIEKDKETDEMLQRETTVYWKVRDEENPYVKKEITPKIEGVVVIAEGGSDPVIVQNITEAVQALFDVDTHKIKVMKLQ